MERITIIGMSPIGASIGLALMRARLRNTEIIGTSVDRNALTTAAKMGAMDKAISNVRSAVEGPSSSSSTRRSPKPEMLWSLSAALPRMSVW